MSAAPLAHGSSHANLYRSSLLAIKQGGSVVEFLYVFGYRTPEQQVRFERLGHDDGDSSAVFIEAGSAPEALSWGRSISEQFIRHLFGDSVVSWKEMNYADWIEEHPESAFTAEVLAKIPHVRYGQHPLPSELDLFA